MKLLFVARRYPPDVQSGTETVFARLYAEAIAAGHEVRLVAGFRRDRALLPADCHAVDLRGGRAAGWAAMAWHTVAEARAFRPDAVLSNSIEASVPGVPTVTLVHDLNFGGAEGGAGATARKAFYRLQAARLARVVAVSEVTRKALLGIGVAEERVVTVHNGVDLERFHPNPRPADSRVRFVLVSRVLPGKGQSVALDAFGRLRPDQRASLELDVVGAVADSAYADTLRVQAWNLSVRFCFDVPDVAPYYQAADIALFPTRMTEGFGYAAIEAMACGLPVIHSADPAVREATGGIGVEVPRNDPVALRDAMLALAKDPARRAELGAAGRAFVARYRWADVWQRYETVLREAQARRGG